MQAIAAALPRPTRLQTGAPLPLYRVALLASTATTHCRAGPQAGRGVALRGLAPTSVVELTQASLQLKL